MSGRQADISLQTGGTPVSPVVVVGQDPVATLAASSGAAVRLRDARALLAADRPWLPPARETPLLTTRLVLEYDGTDFVGWAKQPGKRSVEAELERALTIVLGGTKPAMIVGGRTDTGVHAHGQVVSYDEEALDPYNLNGLLPADVSVIESVPMAPGFDARNDALSRTYRYRVLRRRARSALVGRETLHWSRPLATDALHACATALEGVHDFRAFTPSESEHGWFRRTVRSAQWIEQGDELVFEITADSYLRHMNRSLVGTMLEVGLGMRSVGEFTELLEGGERRQAGWTAPPHGLSLVRIDYPAGLEAAGS